jgi:hypothetical protein
LSFPAPSQVAFSFVHGNTKNSRQQDTVSPRRRAPERIDLKTEF